LLLLLLLSLLLLRYCVLVQEFATHRYTRSSFRLRDLFDSLSNISVVHDRLFSDYMSQFQTATDSINSASVQLATSVIAATVATQSAVVASVSAVDDSTSQNLLRQVETDLPLSATAAYADVVSKVQDEEAALYAVRQAFIDRLANVMQPAVNGLLQDVVDRNRIVMEDSAYISTLTVQTSIAVSAFTLSEDTRVAPEAQAVTDAYADASTTATSQLQSAVAVEVARANSAMVVMAGTVSYAVASRTGSTDFAAW
jgi:hypothetical protein